MEIICLCRAGFEKEVAAEISEIANVLGVNGYAKTREDSGFVQYCCANAEECKHIVTTFAFKDLTFIRHWFISGGLLRELGNIDRVTPLHDAYNKFIKRVDLASETVGLEWLTLDTNEGKALSSLSKGISRHMNKLLVNAQNAKLGEEFSQWKAQLLFVSGDSAFVGASPKFNGPLWVGGVSRLRVPRSAPSRATLKLEEAWHHFIPRQEWEHRLAPGMRAVDLGAAPGGWTWQLVNKSMMVDAVDNGPMDQRIMESGQVVHKVEDGFAYTPKQRVDWLVCDIADKPAKVSHLIGRWAQSQWFGEAVFNLKLPMKQRYREVQNCRSALEAALESTGARFTLRFKQLYHDREEVTGHIQLCM